MNLFLKPLENFFTKSNLETLKNKFYEEFLNESGSVPGNCLFLEDGVWENDNFFSLKNHILTKYEEVYNHTKYDIDTIMISISTKDKPILTNYIENTLKYILNNHQDFLKDYPEIKSSFQQIKNYLWSKYQLQIYLQREKFKADSIFRYKGSLPNLKKLYSLSINESLIFDTEEISEETFIEVFTKENPSSFLSFNCTTSLVVGYLETISKLFKNLNKKTVVQSKRFLASQGEPISSGNYDTNKTRFLKRKNEQKSLEMILQYIDSLNIMVK
jgi:hypothetical protein